MLAKRLVLGHNATGIMKHFTLICVMGTAGVGMALIFGLAIYVSRKEKKRAIAFLAEEQASRVEGRVKHKAAKLEAMKLAKHDLAVREQHKEMMDALNSQDSPGKLIFDGSSVKTPSSENSTESLEQRERSRSNLSSDGLIAMELQPLEKRRYSLAETKELQKIVVEVRGVTKAVTEVNISPAKAVTEAKLPSVQASVKYQELVRQARLKMASSHPMGPEGSLRRTNVECLHCA